MRDPGFVPSDGYDFESAVDLALFRLATPPASNRVRRVSFAASAAAPLTAAGYGLTNAADPAFDGSTLEVARRTQDVRVFSKYVLYEVVDTVGMGRVCTGDSGGPVFIGELNGGPVPEAHGLVGVVSGSTASGDSVHSCTAGNQYIVRVNTADVRKWVCKATDNALCF
jgi:hypothetical protein